MSQTALFSIQGPFPKSPRLSSQKQKKEEDHHPPLILVVEDNLINLQVICKLLSLLSVRFETANNGYVALQKFQEKCYDLILMDLHMPVMDGFQSAEAIRTYEIDSKRTKQTPIVALTASVMLEVRKKCISFGMNDLLPKPVLLDTLKLAIEKWTKTEKFD